jgi:hypothetical protein
MRALFGYLIAIALGLASQYPKDHAWLVVALLCAALLATALATLVLARDRGVRAKWADAVGRSRLASRAAEEAGVGRRATESAPRKVPRPAGPVGPMPVMQKPAKNAAGAPIGTSAPGDPQGSTGSG